MPVVAGFGGAHGRAVVPMTGTTAPIVSPMPVSVCREDDEMVASTPHSARHWDHAYAQGASTRSWFQPEPTMSVRMLQAAGVSAGDSVLDVGGGASGALLARGSSDVTVLDILEQLRSELKEKDIGLAFARLSEPVRDLFKRSGFLERVGEANIHYGLHKAVAGQRGT